MQAGEEGPLFSFGKEFKGYTGMEKLPLFSVKQIYRQTPKTIWTKIPKCWTRIAFSLKTSLFH
ncbi:MAG: hypothetical protein H6577_00880 [Lewinellaceae bacterium]|nr:hypothetical protein [Lewinellaceae bacterium]